MKMLVLAGGFGTRLQSTIPGIPKALAPVNGAPFLRFQIEHWVDQGVKSFVFLLHYQAGLVVDFLRGEQSTSLRDSEVQWLVEPVPLGTGGALAFAVDRLRLTDDFLVTNADTWLGTGISELMRFGAPAMAVVRVKNAGRFGRVLVDSQDHRIKCFEEKNASDRAGWINAGLYKLNPVIFRYRSNSPFSLEKDMFQTLAADGKLHAVPLESDFIDIGIPEDYFRFCRWIEAGRGGSLCS